MDEFDLYITASSAYSKMLHFSKTRSRSFIRRMNKSGPSIDPCGTPVIIDSFEDYVNDFSVSLLQPPYGVNINGVNDPNAFWQRD